MFQKILIFFYVVFLPGQRCLQKDVSTTSIKTSRETKGCLISIQFCSFRLNHDVLYSCLAGSNIAEITKQLSDILTSTLDTAENIYSTNKKFVHILESAIGTNQPINCANSERKMRCFSLKNNAVKGSTGKTPLTTFFESAFTLGSRTIKN